MLLHPALELSYCTNVHPAESFSQILHVITHDIPQIKSSVAPHQAMGTGLRISADMIATLQQDYAQKKFIDALESSQSYVFTINGFPYGTFTTDQVKEKVYLPDWSQDERCDYTIALAQLMTILPGPSQRSISTVAGGFQPQPLSHDKGKAFTKQFTRLIHALINLEEQSGIRICVALEPEPWTSLERVDEIPEFFDMWVRPAHPLATRYIGICYDTCHQALAFEDAQDNWTRLSEHNIPVYKVQVSNALQVSSPFDIETQNSLFQFIEPRYLHQVSALTQNGALKRLLDLPMLANLIDQKTPSAQDWLQANTWRCHVHVPIWWKGHAALQTTQAHWQNLTRCIADSFKDNKNSSPLHVEIETYSWSVIPQSHQRGLGGIHQGIIKEFECFKAVFQEALTT